MKSAKGKEYDNMSAFLKFHHEMKKRRKKAKIKSCKKGLKTSVRKNR